MRTPTERQQLIAQLAAFPAALEEKIAQYGEARLDTPVRPGEWTIRQIVHHVADAHLTGYMRMKLILTERTPILKPYDQDAWAVLPDMSMPIEPSLHIVRGVHARWVLTLQDLPAESWARTGVHLENGLVTLDDLLGVYAGHCQAHLGQIDQLPL